MLARADRGGRRSVPRVGLAGRGGRGSRAAEPSRDLHSDRTLFSRALTNVIENALYAMPGGGTLTIVSQRTAGGGPQTPSSVVPRVSGTIVVSVSDTGVGMDEEALAKIFEPYFSTKATGTEASA